MKSLIRLSLVTAALVFLAPSPSLSGWFGPNNTKECVENYKEDAQAYDAYNTMVIGCQLWFEQSEEKYGKCLLEHFEDVKSEEGTLYLTVACDLLSHDTFSPYHGGAECMLDYVDKITDDDSKMFFINLKCNLNLNQSTTTTHQNGSTTTTTKKYGN